MRVNITNGETKNQNMNEDHAKDDTREGVADTVATGARTNKRRGGGKIGDKQEGAGLLDKTPTREREEHNDIPQGETENPLGRVSKVSIRAVIPTYQYANIQPEIEMLNVGAQEGLDAGMQIIREMFAQYGENPLKVKPVVSAVAKLKSFTEDVEVDFDPIGHTYSYNGQTLTGATTFIKRFYKEFDTAAISAACAKSWEVPAEDIQRLWKANGDITGEMGTLVHKVLEHYEKHKVMGAIIAAKNGKENPAKPKHPVLRRIVDEFEALEKPAGEIHAEVLVTDVKSGLCGQADRILVVGEKKCRVQDYKVNVDSAKEEKNSKPLAPWDMLPPSKISKYQLQLSFYSNLLQRAGWEVDGLDVFVYEESWKHYELPVLAVC